MGIKEKIQRHRGGLLENTVMLYILQFSNMALGLVTQGYQMRVLGVELIGVLGAAQYATNFSRSSSTLALSTPPRRRSPASGRTRTCSTRCSPA